MWYIIALPLFRGFRGLDGAFFVDWNGFTSIVHGLSKDLLLSFVVATDSPLCEKPWRPTLAISKYKLKICAIA